MYHIFSSQFSSVSFIQLQKNNWHHTNMHVHIYDIASISTILAQNPPGFRMCNSAPQNNESTWTGVKQMTLPFFTVFLFVLLCAKNKDNFPQRLFLSLLSRMIQKKKKQFVFEQDHIYQVKSSGTILSTVKQYLQCIPFKSSICEFLTLTNQPLSDFWSEK